MIANNLHIFEIATYFPTPLKKTSKNYQHSRCNENHRASLEWKKTDFKSREKWNEGQHNENND
jgi:hypothetical protein